jgi:hypothetical protein
VSEVKLSPWGFPLENPEADRLHALMRRQSELEMERRQHWIELEMFYIWLDWYREHHKAEIIAMTPRKGGWPKGKPRKIVREQWPSTSQTGT